MWSRANATNYITREVMAQELESFARHVLSPMLVELRENMRTDLEDQMIHMSKSAPRFQLPAKSTSRMSGDLVERSSPMPQIPDTMDHRGSGLQGINTSPMQQRLLQHELLQSSKSLTVDIVDVPEATERDPVVEEPVSTKRDHNLKLSKGFVDQCFYEALKEVSDDEEPRAGEPSYIMLPQEDTELNVNSSQEYDLEITASFAHQLSKGRELSRHIETRNREGSSTETSTTKLRCFHELHEMAIRVTRSSNFDQSVAFVIIVNAIFIGWQTEYMCQHYGKSVPLYFTVAEAICCIFFTVELTLRILAQGREFFIAREARVLNLFDFLMVAIQILDNVLRLILEGRQDQHLTFYLSIFRFTRLVRVIRVLRMVGLIVELRAMLASILESTKPLFFALLLLFLMIYSLGVFFTQIALELRSSHEHARQLPALERYYGSLIITMLSLYEAITNGSDWGEMLKPLLTASPVMAGIFCFYIAFSILAVMNTITGLFVERALLKSNEDKDVHIVQHVNELFRNSNLNEFGQLTWLTFCEKLESPELKELFAALDVDRSEAQALFMLLDTDSNGCVDPDELMSGWAALRGVAKSLDLSLLMHETSRMNAWATKHVSLIQAQVSWIADVLFNVYGPAHENSYAATLSEEISQRMMSSYGLPETSAMDVNSSSPAYFSIKNTRSNESQMHPTPMFLRRMSNNTKMASLRRSIKTRVSTRMAFTGVGSMRQDFHFD